MGALMTILARIGTHLNTLSMDTITLFFQPVKRLARSGVTIGKDTVESPQNGL